MDELLVDFITETRETLETLASEIVAWETAPSDRALLDSIFRFVHTVKGSCGFLNLPRLGLLSHAAEDVLADCRAERLLPDAALVTAVLAVIDRISALTEALESGEAIIDDDAQLIAALRPGAAAPAQNPLFAPSSAPAAAEPETLAQDGEDETGGRMVSQQAPSAPARGSPRSIRLPVQLLDRMMAGVSDMVLARNDLSRRLRDNGADPAIDAAFERLTLCIGEMRESITRTRMARIENLFSALPRMVRDVSAELGKRVVLEIDGNDVELDREMIEMIRDPLTHIVRNAIDHGIESPGDRVLAGKSVHGRLRVSARQAGNQIAIEAVDDGGGIDADRLLAKAIENNVLSAEKAVGMSWHAKLQLIFTPGLSTAQNVTSISGRGVGMDVVRANVERIGGLVEVDSRPGQGTRLSMKVPLTLTIIPALTVSAGGHQFAIPRSAIDELVRVNGVSARLGDLGGAKVVNIRGRRLSVVMLASFLGLESQRPDDQLTMVVLKPAGGDIFAVAVDEVHDHEELVVKPAAPALMATGIYAGTTLPDNSHPMLLLDPGGIAQMAGLLGQSVEADDIIPAAGVVVDTTEPTLIFRDLDNVERAIQLALVERIDEAPAHSIAFSAGRLRISRDDKLVPLMSCGPIGDRASFRVLRMSDGNMSIAYAISEVIDIVPMDIACEPAIEPGLVAGVTLVDGRPVELIDIHWLFAEASRDDIGPAHQPLCLLSDSADPWSRQVLLPLLRSAGYRVTFPDHADANEADIILTGAEADDRIERARDLPMIHLTTHRDDSRPDRVYRYDRKGLLETLRRQTGGRRRAS